MTELQRKIAITTTLFGAIGFSTWFYFKPEFEPAIGLILTLGSFLGYLKFNSKYKKNRLVGKVKFDYSNNNGIYNIGKNELAFETKWSKASKQSIHLYNDPAVISGIAVANDIYQIKDVKNASQFDFSSRVRTIKKHEIAILKNKYGNYAAIKVIDIKDNTRGDDKDELYYEYVINPDNRTNYS